MGLEPCLHSRCWRYGLRVRTCLKTCFARKRSGNRPWLLPLVVVALFAIGMIAASTHVQSIPRAMGSLDKRNR